MDIYQIKVSRFASYKANRTDGQVNLWEWLLRKDSYTPTVYKIRSMADEAKIRDLKALLSVFSRSLLVMGNLVFLPLFLIIMIDNAKVGELFEVVNAFQPFTGEKTDECRI